MIKPTEVNFFGMNNIITAEDRAGEIELFTQIRGMRVSDKELVRIKEVQERAAGEIEVILKEAPNESGLSQHIASATAKHYLDFALEVDFFCATEVLFFCEERFWATCFFEEGFLLLATEVLLAAFFEATVVRFLLETALCFELDRLDESVCLPFFCDLETTCLALLCESAASEAVR